MLKVLSCPTHKSSIRRYREKPVIAIFAACDRNRYAEPARMVVCPFDCHWCDLQGCRAGGCEMTGEPVLVACSLCGALVIRTAGLGACIDCMAAELHIAGKEVN